MKSQNKDVIEQITRLMYMKLSWKKDNQVINIPHAVTRVLYIPHSVTTCRW